MKLCPKCRAKNWPDKEECAICGASLQGVALTQNTNSKAPASVGASATQLNQTQQSVPNQTQQVTTAIPAVQPTQQLPVGMPQMPVYQAPPIKKANPLPIILVGVVVLIGMVFAALQMAPKKEPLPKAPPENTIVSFLAARKTLEFSKVEPLLSEESHRFLKNAFSSRAARSAGFDRAEVIRMYVYDMPPSPKELTNAEITYKDISSDEEKKKDLAVIEMSVTEKSPVFGEMTSSYLMVLVPEDGQWKIDLPMTTAYQTSAAMDGLMQRK